MSNDYLIPALAPAWKDDLMCPHWAERWQLQTRPLGCQVSTTTSLTAIVTGMSTLAVVLFMSVVFMCARSLRHGQARSLVEAWLWLWRAPEYLAPVSPRLPSEESPLLSDIR